MKLSGVCGTDDAICTVHTYTLVLKLVNVHVRTYVHIYQKRQFSENVVVPNA